MEVFKHGEYKRVVLLARKNQSKFEWRPIRKQYFEIWIDFYALSQQRRRLLNLALSYGTGMLVRRLQKNSTLGNVHK